MAKKILAANWKMNPQSYSDAERLASDVAGAAKTAKGAEVILCPPFVWLTDLSRKRYRGVAWGAQDVFWEKSGPYTGEISSDMLKSSGVKYAIIGHSERRRWLGETDKTVNKKIKAALAAGLEVILCVGEPKRAASDKRQGLRKAKNYVRRQLEKDLEGISLSRVSNRMPLIIAYEPVWAIGTGRADKPADTAEMAKFIKQFLFSTFHFLHSRVLYGGSVNGKNAESFLRLKEINGALVGGASLKVGEFKKIIYVSSKYGQV